jgi:hypothetical protein
MMIFKESRGRNDEQLFGKNRYNLLVRSGPGLTKPVYETLALFIEEGAEHICKRSLSDACFFTH